MFIIAILFPVTLFAAPPVNDDCAGAITRPSSTSCTNAQYNIQDATASTGIPVGCASGGTHYDIWFVFTATQTTHTVTVSSLGAGITSPELQLFSGTCGSLTSLACGTTFVTGSGLTVGNVYYIRFSNVGAAIPANGLFDICITNSGTPPVNDECSGAISLTSNTSCNNVSYSMRYATASSGIPVGCAAGGTHYDVWYSFTAQGTSQTVTISNLGNSITSSELQLFSGTCGSLTSVACGTTTLTGTGLTIGNTYYIRVSNIGSSPTNNGQSNFNICVTHPPTAPVNDLCAGATTLTSGVSCVTTTGNLFYATSTNLPAGGCGSATSTTTFDVWYKFQATATTHAITVSGLGSKLTSSSTYMELLSGACGSLTSLSCQAVSTTSGRLTNTSLTVGTFYYVRVYVVSNPTATPSSGWNFDICVQDPPANDDCSGVVTLTPGATCSNTAGTLDLATSNTTGVVTSCWAANTYNDVWYKFVATGVTHTITLSSLGANLLTPRIQIYSGTCGTLAILGCATTSTLTQPGLVAGVTYYVRIANTTNPSGAGGVAGFNICVTNVAVAPSNDNCSGAILLTSGSTCTNVSGTLLNATANGASSCINTSSADVWYSFVAQSAYPTIDLSNYAFPNIGGSTTPRIELYDGSGGCGSLGTSIACGTEPLTVSGAGLTIGNTYYVRVGTNKATGVQTSGAWGFKICITDPTNPAVVDYSKSYVNITDGTVGGTIDPGDVIEIRATLVVQRSLVPVATATIDSIAFLDTLKAGGGFSLDTSSISTKTNEGKLYKSFTGISSDADAGWFTTAGAGTDTTIQINIGSGASKSAKGQLSSNSKPSFYSNTCIIMATYRVTVNKAYGSKINFGGGSLQYRDKQTGLFYTINFPKDSLMVFQSPGSCQNLVSSTNILGDEYNGSFGTSSGSPVYPQNRAASANTNYLYKVFNPSGPNDYYYGIANNTSATSSTSQTVAKPNANRVFSLWDITGDHTGASNTAKGNAPCNLSAPISATNPCGYMMVVNAAYKTDTAFQFNVAGACPNTYYEISAWFKNICYKCGCDSMGTGASGAGYIPTATGDSSGVRPNLAVEVDGVDYYTTGDILYQGLSGTQTGSDTLNNWVQKAFVYKTGPSQTSFTMSLRNNAPGGGGNDWAIDDIALKTCTPTMTYSPSVTPIVCQGNAITISDTVRCYYNTYTEYKWQRSTNGGSTWTDVGSSGTATPAWNGSAWEYTSNYTVPASNTNYVNDGDLYRLVVATSASNLSGACSFSEATPITISISSCNVLKVDLLSISGSIENGYGKIKWVTSQENEPVKFELQRSNDGNNFKTITFVQGYNNSFFETNNYSYPDAEIIDGKAFYRVVMINSIGAKKYSRVVELKYAVNDFTLTNVINPFTSELNFDVNTNLNGYVSVELLDQFGQKQVAQKYTLQKGINALTLYNAGKLSAGIYILRVERNGTILTHKVIKVKN